MVRVSIFIFYGKSILKQFMCLIMCANVKIYFALWLRFWLSFYKIETFLETVLQMLLICLRHFSGSCTVTSSKRCFEICSIVVI